MRKSGSTALAAVIVVLVVIGLFAGLALAVAGGNGNDAFQVHVSFNERATDADASEVQDLLRKYDQNADLAILESFPPQGVAVVTTDDPNFCGDIVNALEAKSYVAGASCGSYTPAGDDADEPVSTTNNSE